MANHVRFVEEVEEHYIFDDEDEFDDKVCN